MPSTKTSTTSSSASGHRRASKLSPSLRGFMSPRPSINSGTAHTKESSKTQRHRQGGYVPITSNDGIRPAITTKPTSKPTSTNPTMPNQLNTCRSTTSSTTCMSMSSSDADSCNRSASPSAGSIDQSKAWRELQDLVKVKDEEISYLRAQLASVEFENTNLASENMTLRLTAEQDSAVMEEKLRDANEQIRQHEAMADDFIKDVARLTLELKEAKAEARGQRAKVEKMQGKLHKVVEDGSAFIQGLANQLNTTEEQLEKVKCEYNSITLSARRQAENHHDQIDHATINRNDGGRIHKDNSRRCHRHHNHNHSAALKEADKQELLATIVDVADRHTFDDMVVKPPSPIDSRLSSATDHHHDKRMALPPLEEVEIITSKLKPPVQQEKRHHQKRHKQVKVERAGRAA